MRPFQLIERRNEEGQIVLITLLVLTVAITVILSLISRNTTDNSIINETEQSARAFNAAEAGIEEALKTGQSNLEGLVTAATAQGNQKTSYKTEIVAYGASSGIYAFPKRTQKGVSETLWLVPHNGTVLDESQPFGDNAVTFCWSSASPAPAIVATLFYKHNGVEYRNATGAYDPQAGRVGTNNFTLAGNGGCQNTAAYFRTLNFFTDFGLSAVGDLPLFLHIRPVYNDAQFSVETVSPLPIQGKRIDSTGTADNGINRKIIVYQQFPSHASIFDAALYSEGSITH